MSSTLLQPTKPARTDVEPELQIDAGMFREKFDSELFGFNHNLHELSLFSQQSLLEVAQRYDSHAADYFVTSGAPAAGAEFFSVPRAADKPSEAIAKLDSSSVRILLKRPENHHAGFRELLEELFAQVLRLRGGLKGERLVRLEGGLFITSAASTTPFHFDPEIAFFSQIEGEKVYHVYPPAVVDESELERFYLRGEVSIGQVSLSDYQPNQERVFKLGPGLGLHQPQNSPHWVQTTASRSVSYSFVFETDASRARGAARACNYYLRKLGMRPQTLGTHPTRDATKARAMKLLIPVRRRIGTTLRALRIR